MRSDTRARMRATLIATTVAAAATLGCEGARDRDKDERDKGEQTRPTAQAERPQDPGAPQPGARTAEAPKKGPQTDATIDQVKERPADFYGKEITVAGKVDKLINERTFELEGTGWAFNDNITVLTKSPAQLATAAVAGKQELVVTGTVRPFVVADVERELGWDLAPEVEVRLKERPVLLAERIRRVSDQDGWTAEAGDRADTGPLTSMVTIITAIDLRALAGRQVDLGRERVQAVAGKGLWVGPSAMSQIFVLPTETPKDLQPGDMVRVSGTLREVPKDAAATWGLPKEMTGRVQSETLYLDGATVKELPAAEKAPATQTPAATQPR